jgi:glutamyl-tRNA(Gln) amidotransferase subunit E
MAAWGIPEDTYTFILSKNLYPVMRSIILELDFDPKAIGTFFGHHLKSVIGRYRSAGEFSFNRLFDLFRFIKTEQLDPAIARKMLPVWYQHPKMDFESVLTNLKFKRYPSKEIEGKITFLKEKFSATCRNNDPLNMHNWVMGQLRPVALGNVNLSALAARI